MDEIESEEPEWFCKKKKKSYPERSDRQSPQIGKGAVYSSQKTVPVHLETGEGVSISDRLGEDR